MASRAKSTNKFVAPLVIVFLLLSSLIYFSTATAANISDTDFHFDLNSAHKTAGTSIRDKHNSSSVYVHVKTKTMEHCSLHVDGCRGDGTPFTDRTVGGKAMVYKTGKFRIKNLVHERGETHCRLTAFKTDGSGKITGVWSPDCAGSYPALN